MSCQLIKILMQERTVCFLILEWSTHYLDFVVENTHLVLCIVSTFQVPRILPSHSWPWQVLLCSGGLLIRVFRDEGDHSKVGMLRCRWVAVSSVKDKVRSHTLFVSLYPRNSLNNPSLISFLNLRSTSYWRYLPTARCAPNPKVPRSKTAVSFPFISHARIHCVDRHDFHLVCPCPSMPGILVHA